MGTDEELFRAWQHGDVHALEVLLQRYHASLVAHLYRVLADVHLAEDLVQETFLKLVREVHSYHYPRPFRPWLFAIAHHLAWNYQRSAYTRHVDLSADLPETPTSELDPAEWLERWEQHDGLHTALAQLTLAHREVLSLRFGQELSIIETASILGVPSGTVKSRTFTALRLLRDLLKQQAFFSEEKKGDHHYA